MQRVDIIPEEAASSVVDEGPCPDARAAPIIAIDIAEDGRKEDYEALFERQRRMFDLAMTASKMGTWRYTIADNVCVYDENAQRLYGLTQSRFLHDEAGVEAKFHPDDMDLMWSRVAAALDPGGDGRYEVEYRVRQLDGSWRWLSAWGVVEFEGDGPTRKPVAITGASRDLTDRKEAEALQRLLLNELKHRVKNTLATVQAIATLTLNNAADLPSAKEALEQRIMSMSKAHDLLIARSWAGTTMSDVVSRALEAFSPAQLDIAGPDVEISPRQTLSLSMALHELATNAMKYGALSCLGGCVCVRWAIVDDKLHLDWAESGGPRVNPPTHQGFGSRLLERLLASELGGDVKMDYEPDGVRCSLTARLDLPE